MLQCYDKNYTVSVAELQQFAQQNLSHIKPGFCASAGFATRFLNRHHLLLRGEDTSSQCQLPPELENNIQAFLMRIQNSVISNYSKDKIGCMDEIPLSFSDLDAQSDQHQLRVRKLSIENGDATVVLSLKANGTLLPPFVTLKVH